MASRFAQLSQRDCSVPMLRVKMSRRRSQVQKENRDRAVSRHRGLHRLHELQELAHDALVAGRPEEADHGAALPAKEDTKLSVAVEDRKKMLARYKEAKALQKEKERRALEKKGGVFKVGVYKPQPLASLPQAPARTKATFTVPSHKVTLPVKQQLPRKPLALKENVSAPRKVEPAAKAVKPRVAPKSQPAPPAGGCRTAPANWLPHAPGAKATKKPGMAPPSGREKTAPGAAKPQSQAVEGKPCGPPLPSAGPAEGDVEPLQPDSMEDEGSPSPSSFAPHGFVFEPPAGLSSFLPAPLDTPSKNAVLTPRPSRMDTPTGVLSYPPSTPKTSSPSPPPPSTPQTSSSSPPPPSVPQTSSPSTPQTSSPSPPPPSVPQTSSPSPACPQLSSPSPPPPSVSQISSPSPPPPSTPQTSSPSPPLPSTPQTSSPSPPPPSTPQTSSPFPLPPSTPQISSPSPPPPSTPKTSSPSPLPPSIPQTSSPSPPPPSVPQTSCPSPLPPSVPQTSSPSPPPPSVPQTSCPSPLPPSTPQPSSPQSCPQLSSPSPSPRNPVAPQSASKSQEPEHDVPYFRAVVASETDRLTRLCEQWDPRAEEPSIPEEIRASVRTTVGQARLLMRERFRQFQGLVDDCALARGERLTTCTDLQGFWDMVFFQVEDVDRKFSVLAEAESRGWKEERKPLPRIKRALKKPPVAAAGTAAGVGRGASAAARSRLAAVKAAMRAKQEPPVGASEPPVDAQTVVFHGGFFQVESPAKVAGSVRRTSLLRAGPSPCPSPCTPRTRPHPSAPRLSPAPGVTPTRPINSALFGSLCLTPRPQLSPCPIAPPGCPPPAHTRNTQQEDRSGVPDDDMQSAPGPVSPSPCPLSSTPFPVNSSPCQVSPSPCLVNSTPCPESPSPGPVNSNPCPISPTLCPTSPTLSFAICPVNSTPCIISNAVCSVSSTPSPADHTPSCLSPAPTFPSDHDYAVNSNICHQIPPTHSASPAPCPLSPAPAHQSDHDYARLGSPPAKLQSKAASQSAPPSPGPEEAFDQSGIVEVYLEPLLPLMDACSLSELVPEVMEASYSQSQLVVRPGVGGSPLAQLGALTPSRHVGAVEEIGECSSPFQRLAYSPSQWQGLNVTLSPSAYPSTPSRGLLLSPQALTSPSGLPEVYFEPVLPCEEAPGQSKLGQEVIDASCDQSELVAEPEVGGSHPAKLGALTPSHQQGSVEDQCPSPCQRSAYSPSQWQGLNFTLSPSAYPSTPTRGLLLSPENSPMVQSPPSARRPLPLSLSDSQRAAAHVQMGRAAETSVTPDVPRLDFDFCVQPGLRGSQSPRETVAMETLLADVPVESSRHGRKDELVGEAEHIHLSGKLNE